MDKQKTIAKEVSLKGIGLHTSNKVNVTFKPAEADKGINFIRVDLASKPVIKVAVDNLLPIAHSLRRTSVGQDSAEIQTIEHLMAAIAGLEIDNLYIEMDNNEVPGLDGSSKNFVELLSRAGIREQEKEKQAFAVKEPIFAEEEGSSIIALPYPEFKISYTLSYNHPLLHSGFMELVMSPEFFEKELAPARTFCLEDEAQELQRQGLGQGANYENTLVVGKNGVIKNKLRFDDEFVRHKIVDLIGDLYLVGCPLKAHIIALRSGHSLNLKLVKRICLQKERYSAAGVKTSYHPSDAVEGFGIEMIMKILPHREPFLFVDKVIHFEQGKHATGVKNLTINDDFFRGHFPGRPVMPGVLIIEALAQVGGIMMLAPEENRGKLAFFMGVDNVRFRKPVVPGDQLVLDVKAGRMKAKTGQVRGQAFVDGRIVAEADMMFALVEG
jgi:UDP-3-O-[3-hydroxymyristoyl] N-acetylglucosamine deacetylase / 3-hydroxyacyl-[acyl-carrier-protein] dehydratase